MSNARRSNLKLGEPNLDFIIDGPETNKYVDIKSPIEPGKFPSRNPESFDEMGKRVGEKITIQKGGDDRVLHLVDLDQIPNEAKANLKEQIIKGAGSSKGIEFIN